MQFLQQQLFTTPVWLMDKKISAAIGYGEKDMITSLQSNVLNTLLNGATIDKLINFETYEPSKAYTAAEMLNDLKKGNFYSSFLFTLMSMVAVLQIPTHTD